MLSFIKKIIKKVLPASIRRQLRKSRLDNDLRNLSIIYLTDKGLGHSYVEHYNHHFKKFKNKKINLLEIGIGGYENSNLGGNSLRMWKRYFRRAQIFGLDIYDKTGIEEERIKTFKGSQVDKNFLNDITSQIGEIDIIIDDGSHINDHIIKTFEFLFPKLKDGGIYAVEDLQTSYWPYFGGDSEDLNNPATAMNYFKKLTDCLNSKEFLIPDYQQTYFDKKIVSMHFYHNLVFIYKGNNDEESNMVVHGRLNS